MYYKISLFLIVLFGRVCSQSWDDYLDNLIEQSKDGAGQAQCDKAAIFSLDGGAPWTSTDYPNALNLSQDERSDISKGFNSLSLDGIFLLTKITVEGINYDFLIEYDNNLVLYKNKGHGSIIIQRSVTALVACHVVEGGHVEYAVKAVITVADHFEASGF
ncbi:profilin-like [Ruditapes philippinarum]|uniref:profilin-like n=1 Tax=Ruditapes philippinarum TaxID=129788 RepID=UPI00295B676F|nr:profilin-like [Ruditapes philippinarum]